MLRPLEPSSAETERRDALTRELLDLVARHTASAPNEATCGAAADAKWLRVSEAVRIYSISRTRLYELISDGTVRSVSLRKKHQVRGARRVSASSLDAFFEQNAVGGRAA